VKACFCVRGSSSHPHLYASLGAAPHAITELNAIDMTLKINFESSCLVRGLCPFFPFVTMPSAPTPPRSVYKLFHDFSAIYRNRKRQGDKETALCTFDCVRWRRNKVPETFVAKRLGCERVRRTRIDTFRTVHLSDNFAPTPRGCSCTNRRKNIFFGKYDFLGGKGSFKILFCFEVAFVDLVRIISTTDPPRLPEGYRDSLLPK